MQGGNLVSFGRVRVPLCFPAREDLSDKAILCLLNSVCRAAEATGEIIRERRKVPGCWLGGRGALCRIMQTGLASLPLGDYGATLFR